MRLTDFVCYATPPSHTHTHIHTHTLFLMDNIKMMEIITTKIKWKMHALFTLYFKFWRIQPPDFLFFVVFISFYISRSHFSQIFRTSFNITWKRDFCHKFSFFNRFTQTAPLTAKIHSVWRKFFCQCSLYVPTFGMTLVTHDIWIYIHINRKRTSLWPMDMKLKVAYCLVPISIKFIT